MVTAEQLGRSSDDSMSGPATAAPHKGRTLIIICSLRMLWLILDLMAMEEYEAEVDAKRGQDAHLTVA